MENEVSSAGLFSKKQSLGDQSPLGMENEGVFGVAKACRQGDFWSGNRAAGALPDWFTSRP